jgi:hypothetical protein
MSREKSDDEITQTTFLRLEGDAKLRDASYKVDQANKQMAEAIKDVMKDDVPTIKARMKSAPPPVEVPDYGKHSFSAAKEKLQLELKKMALSNANLLPA